jgi:hypothetical protein
MNRPGASRLDSELTNLELLGLLSSRIIHDLKNKLAVISGHAQFAEMSKQNPQAAASGMAIIKRVSEEAGKHVEALAKLRRALPTERHECDPADALAVLGELLAGRQSWELRAPDAGNLGKIAVERRWLRFILRHFITACEGTKGTVTVDQARGEVPVEGADVAPLFPERQCFRVRIRCGAGASEKPPLNEDPVLQFQTIAVYELIRKLEGGLVQQAGPDGIEEIVILIPLAQKVRAHDSGHDCKN